MREKIVSWEKEMRISSGQLLEDSEKIFEKILSKKKSFD